MVNRINSTQRRSPFMFVAVVVVYLACGPVIGDTYTPTRVWDNGGANGDWSLAGGWNPSGLPISTDLVAVDNGATLSYSSSGVSVTRLYFGSDLGKTGHMTMTGGDLTVSTAFRVGDEDLGTFTLSAGDLVAGNQFWVGARGPLFGDAGDGTFNIEGGTFSFGGSISNSRVGLSDGTGVVNQTGGTVTGTNAGGGLYVSITVSGGVGHGTYNISGSSSFNLAGTLIVDGTAGDGQGDGHYKITGSAANITVGAYTQNEGGNLYYTSDAAGVAAIQSVGDVAVNGALNIDLSALTANPSTILLIDNLSANAIGGAFTNAAEGTVFGDYTLTYLYDNGGGVGNDLALLLSSLHPGDANGDGMVNLSDLQILGDNWQSNTATWAEADFTGDGIVNLADLQILGDNWGFGVGPDVALDEALANAAIPEPASLVLLSLGAIGLLRRRG
ncbi:MAG: PEP-CTERM sorting domain-containing protein [Phycisphaeraceae bacterium]|nr:PEP-CTERM sorting domain-containing protein [Phycisphaeraceae bacterium]